MGAILGVMCIACFLFGLLVAMPLDFLTTTSLKSSRESINHSWWKPFYLRHGKIRVISTKDNYYVYHAQFRLGWSHWQTVDRFSNQQHAIQFAEEMKAKIESYLYGGAEEGVIAMFEIDPPKTEEKETENG
jgi:ABC-type glycerol-3-phosphate transport system permease component